LTKTEYLLGKGYEPSGTRSSISTRVAK
jgi:hypothetical protein